MNKALAYCLIPLAFLGDLCILNLFNSSVFLTRTLFYTLIISGSPLFTWVLCGFFSLLYSFVLTGLVGTDLLIMLPLGWMLSYIRRVTQISVVSFAVLCACLTIHALYDSAILKTSFHFKSLLLAFISSLFMLYLLTGSQGNRSLR
jgi:hypothetical protein